MADNKLQSLKGIFNERIFRIPDFQRGYSWQEPQLSDFWNDLTNLKEDKIHYIGLLTVEPVKKKDVDKWQDARRLSKRDLSAYYIIDGQQRLTTAIIFIDQLLKQFTDDEEINSYKKKEWVTKFLYQKDNIGYPIYSYIFSYEKDDPSDEYFKTRILDQESSTADKVPEQTLYTANLKFAKEFFADKLKEKNKSELEDLFKKVANKFQFNFYEIDDELDVYVTFETMNNRGKPLSNLELLKNRLIYLTTLLDDKSELDELRKDINETWKTIYEYLGKNKDNVMDDDKFLYNHWIMYFNKYNRKESASYAKFLLNNKFTAKNILNGNLITSEIGEIKNYIDSLAKAVKSWFYLFNPKFSDYQEETKEWFQKLSRLGMSAFPPLFMAAMTTYTTEDKVVELLQSAEKFIFLVFRLSQRPSNTKSSHFYRLANSFYSNKDGQDIDTVIEDINQTTQGKDGLFDLKKFQQCIVDKYKKEQGFYSWKGLQYFLYEYELDCQKQAKEKDQKVTWMDFNKRKKEDTIEHIYPQTPKDDCWKSQFADYSEDRCKKLLHSLGNLVLLARFKNSELQNKCFDFKKKYINKKGNKVGFFNGSFSEIQVSDCKNWTPHEIFERGIKMLKFMSCRWNINFEDLGISKKNLLQLDFINEQIENDKCV